MASPGKGDAAARKAAIESLLFAPKAEAETDEGSAGELYSSPNVSDGDLGGVLGGGGGGRKSRSPTRRGRDGSNESERARESQRKASAKYQRRRSLSQNRGRSLPPKSADDLRMSKEALDRDRATLQESTQRRSSRQSNTAASGGKAAPAAAKARGAAPTSSSGASNGGGKQSPRNAAKAAALLGARGGGKDGKTVAAKAANRAAQGCEGGQLQTAPISVVFHSFRPIFRRAIISRSDLERGRLSSERARGTAKLKRR